MSVPIAIGLYFICWWLAFFIMLPIGVRTPEADAVEPGMADSAPIAPYLWREGPRRDHPCGDHLRHSICRHRLPAHSARAGSPPRSDQPLNR